MWKCFLWYPRPEGDGQREGGPLSKAAVQIPLENVYLNPLDGRKSCWFARQTCSHSTSRDGPSGVQVGLSGLSWWPVHCMGMHEEWDTWPPAAQGGLVSLRRRMWGWEEHSVGRTVVDTPREGGEYKWPGSQCQQEALSTEYAYGTGSRKMITRPCWGCRVPEGQCLLGGCLGPSTTRCPHSHTTDRPHYSQKPQESPFFLQRAPVLCWESLTSWSP